MNNQYLTKLIPAVLEAKEAYGETNTGGGQKVQVEFVSANPTGDLHLGHARGAAVGDSLCNILDKAGFEVSREYYINDAGNQINNLALSVEVRYFEALGLEKRCLKTAIEEKTSKASGKSWQMNLVTVSCMSQKKNV